MEVAKLCSMQCRGRTKWPDPQGYPKGNQKDNESAAKVLMKEIV
jgi:hypothetical protein